MKLLWLKVSKLFTVAVETDPLASVALMVTELIWFGSRPIKLTFQFMGEPANTNCEETSMPLTMTCTPLVGILVTVELTVKLTLLAGFTNTLIRPFDWLHPAVPRELVGIVSAAGLLLEAVPAMREFAGSLCVNAERP